MTAHPRYNPTSTHNSRPARAWIVALAILAGCLTIAAVAQAAAARRDCRMSATSTLAAAMAADDIAEMLNEIRDAIIAGREITARAARRALPSVN